MNARRSDTKERIQQVALELFAEQGYDKTSLREVAERLEITRPALYYHFKAKEDILTSVIDDLNGSIDELVEWARAQPHTEEARGEILRRIAALLNDHWRPLIRFAQVNQAVMSELPAGEQMQRRMMTMISVLSAPEDGLVRQFEARLAVIALIMGSVPFLLGMEVPEEERSAIALTVAARLVADR
ncbi:MULTISPECIES: TetR/AcrR family transcriptional regulator [unclassified Streptosporangium]|jgi:AcrR family transcriptional regulator|uniref:TetR/AcrR family transcriptional regulator n=1 Tax=unclassified Streptosporangium TaxID=2632669 RepID=UPI003318486C